jgi:hypothetical protein
MPFTSKTAAQARRRKGLLHLNAIMKAKGYPNLKSANEARERNREARKRQEEIQPQQQPFSIAPPPWPDRSL